MTLKVQHGFSNTFHETSAAHDETAIAITVVINATRTSH
jgi:hypothetical protein